MEEDKKLISNNAHPIINVDNSTLKNGSVWNVTGTSYITSLTVDATSSVAVPADMGISVNGNPTLP